MASRGPLAGGDTPASRQEYKCSVEDCDFVCRGDKLQDHYRKSSACDVLLNVKVISNTKCSSIIIIHKFEKSTNLKTIDDQRLM